MEKFGSAGEFRRKGVGMWRVGDGWVGGEVVGAVERIE